MSWGNNTYVTALSILLHFPVSPPLLKPLVLFSWVQWRDASQSYEASTSFMKTGDCAESPLQESRQQEESSCLFLLLASWAASTPVAQAQPWWASRLAVRGYGQFRVWWSQEEKGGTEKQSPTESTWGGCILQQGSITGLVEASHCLENDADVTMMLPLYLEMERRKESGRGSCHLLRLSERPEMHTCPWPQVTWDFLENIIAFQETVLQKGTVVSTRTTTKPTMMNLCWTSPYICNVGMITSLQLEKALQRGKRIVGTGILQMSTKYGGIKSFSRCPPRAISQSRDQSESVIQKRCSAPGLSLGPALLEPMAQTEVPSLVQGPAPHGTPWCSGKQEAKGTESCSLDLPWKGSHGPLVGNTLGEMFPFPSSPLALSLFSLLPLGQKLSLSYSDLRSTFLVKPLTVLRSLWQKALTCTLVPGCISL